MGQLLQPKTPNNTIASSSSFISISAPEVAERWRMTHFLFPHRCKLIANKGCPPGYITARCVWRTEYHIKLAPIADHRMWGQLNKQNLVYKFMGTIWQLNNKTTQRKKTRFGTWIPSFFVVALSDNPCSVDLIYSLRTSTGSNFWPLCFRATTLPSMLSVVGDLSSSTIQQSLSLSHAEMNRTIS